jgi:hypothetical protein
MEVINQKLGNNRFSLPEGHVRLFLIGNLRTRSWMKIKETASGFAFAEGLNRLSSQD